MTIAAGARHSDRYRDAVDDTAVEQTETVILTISSNAAYTIGTSGTATVNLYDDDTPATVVTVTAQMLRQKNSNKQGDFHNRQSRQYGGCVTVNYAMSGTAASGSDYTPCRAV